MLANSSCPIADAGVVYGKKTTAFPIRPHTIGPVLDAISTTTPLASFDADLHRHIYLPQSSGDGRSTVPAKPESFSDPYLYPMLTRNERLRLTMLWYYTRDLADDTEILDKMQTKVDLLKSIVGWDFAICGLLENDIYRRLATAGLPLAILPRRESTCAHTVQQTPGSVLFLSDMSSDWRFAQSPHVSQGGIRSYAGAQLQCQIDNDQSIALGSVCIASNTPNRDLDPSQLDLLVKFADMLTEDIVSGFRRKRAKQQRQNDVLLRAALAESLRDPNEGAVLKIAAQVFPEAQISLLPIEAESIQLDANGPLIVLPDLQSESAVWENHALIDELLRTNNHSKLVAAEPIRAIIGRVRNQHSEKALVVSVADITRIYDDIDVRFVEACALILRSIMQEKSLREAAKARERFMRGITHQLRTPIHGILGSVDLLTDECAQIGQQGDAVSSTTFASKNLSMIKSSGRELMSTVNNIIKFNRWAESVNMPKTATLHDPRKLESDILEEISWLLPEEHLDGISIFFHDALPHEVALIQIDPTLLKDCLQALIVNALQNTMRGSVAITTSTTSDYSSIAFDVEDTGCGIAPAHWQRIFDAYEKCDTHSSRAGLGLTLSCKIADTLDGSVTLVSSTLGEGSHFRAEFRNPGFVCMKEQLDAALASMRGLPDRFAIIPSDPPSALDQYLARFLKARGLKQSSEVTGALAIVSFTNTSEQYQELLRQAAESVVAISLVPAGADLHTTKDSYPNILFFSGPFTSDRLHEILAVTRDACEARPVVPVANPEAAIDPQPVCNGDATPPPPSSRRGTICPRGPTPHCLLVDDNLINLRILRMYCDKRKLPYKTARDGLEAISAYTSAVKEDPISLILLDLQMPNCDGIQACKEIRALEEKEGLQPAVIFIVTGQDSPADKKRSLDAGADKFYVKPLSLNNLDHGVAGFFSDPP